MRSMSRTLLTLISLRFGHAFTVAFAIRLENIAAVGQTRMSEVVIVASPMAQTPIGDDADTLVSLVKKLKQ